jgi:hypothetical protein
MFARELSVGVSTEARRADFDRPHTSVISSSKRAWMNC